MSRVTAALVLCTSLAIASPASAFGLAELMQALAQVKSSRGTFVERKHMAILSAPLESSGTIAYLAPGRLEKHTRLPTPQSLVLDQDTLTIENPAKNQRRTLALREYPVVWALVESIRSTLAGDLRTLERFYETSLSGQAAQWQLLLKPREPSMQAVVREIRIAGAGNRVHTVEILEGEGDRSVMSLTTEP